MDMFQEMPQQLQTAEGKKIIKNYNKIAKVLLEFEVLYHREWMRQVAMYLHRHPGQLLALDEGIYRSCLFRL